MELFSLSGLAGIVFIIGFWPYIQAIRHSKAQPAKTTWVIWVTLNLIMIVGMIKTNSLNLQIVGITIGAFVVAVLGIKYGKPGFSWLERFCLALAGLAIFLGLKFDSPTLAIVMSCVASVIGATPTFAGAWHHPEKENKWGWTLFWVSCIITVVAVPVWSWETWIITAQPLTFLGIESVMMALLFIKPRLSSI